MGGKLLGVRIPYDLDQKLRYYCIQKHKEWKKGALSQEVSEAIMHWLKLHTNTQEILSVKAPNPTPLIAQRFARIKQYLLGKFYLELNTGQTVAHSHLVEAIMNTFGSDKRTVDKWLKDFATFHVIKRLSYASWEIM